eukprot:GHVS01029632.1.p1 GENE.GHVS01029632.1~~GHVS01029632.1.p1  ORF type:complete len:455 (-),score=60.60 GHVS01029632.1:141-1505(-)
MVAAVARDIRCGGIWWYLHKLVAAERTSRAEGRDGGSSGEEWWGKYAMHRPARLLSVSTGSAVAYVGLSVMVVTTLLCSHDVLVPSTTLWLCLHVVTMLWYFWVGYNPGYLVPADGKTPEEAYDWGKDNKDELSVAAPNIQTDLPNRTTSISQPTAAGAAPSHPENANGTDGFHDEGGWRRQPHYFDAFAYGLDEMDLPLEDFRGISVGLLTPKAGGEGGRADEERTGGEKAGGELRGVEPEVVGHAELAVDMTEDEHTKEDPQLSSYCRVCHIYQPLRCRHCRECNHCVLTFDHHCFFIGGCVGEFNMWRFYVFLVLQTLTLLTDAIVSWSGFHAEFHTIDWLLGNSAVLAVWILCMTFLIPTVILLVYHTYLGLSAQTTWEHLRRSRIPYLAPLPKAIYPFSHGSGIRAMYMNFTQMFKYSAASPKKWEFKWREGDYIPFNLFDNDYYDCGC